MKRLVKFILIATLGLILSLGIRALPQVRAEQPVESPKSAIALVQAGKKYYDAGQFSEAAQLLQRAAQAYEAKGEMLKQAQALSLVSLAQQRLGNWQEAEQAINASLSLLETVPKDRERSPVRAQVLNAQGHWQLAIGKAEDALKTWQDAETLYAQAGDRVGVTGSQINQAQVLETLGFYRRSCKAVLQAFEIEERKCEALTTQTLNQVLETFQKQPNSLQVTGLRSLGNILRLIGNLDQSQAVLKQSLTVAQQLRSPQDESKALLSLGNTRQALATRARSLKDLEAAEKYAQAALDDYRQAAAIAKLPGNLPSLTALQAQLNQLSLSVEIEKWSDAQGLLPQIQVKLSNLPPSRASVYAQVNLVQSLARFKQKRAEAPFSWQDLAVILDSAVQDARRIGDKRAESYALGNLGKLQYDHQLPSAANPQNLLQQALSLAQTENATEIAYRWQWQLGRIYQGQNIQQAIAAYKAAFETLQVLRSDLVALNQEIQFSFREQVEPVYRELAKLLLRPEPGETQPSQQNLQEAREVIEALQLAELDNFFQDACANPKEEEIERVDPQAAVIYTIILPESLEAILSLPDGTLHLHTNFVSQTKVEKTLEQLQQYLKEPDRLRDVQELSKQVYGWLIEPFEDRLDTQIKTLAFVLDGSLQNIPMAVLYDGKQYLAQRYATALTPGLRLLGPERSPRQINALIAGVSEQLQIGEREFTALKNVEDELQAIQSVVPSQTLFNSRFTKTNFQEQLNTNPFSIVHIATHGQFSSDPERTFILLWNQALNVKDLDNLLEIRKRDEPSIIDLLVLSACETATGDKRAALGLAGVAVRAGARSTLASLWQVNDESTAALMGQFYRELIENPEIAKAEALRRAQLEIWKTTNKDWQVPSFWASYILVGNWL